MKLRKTLIVVLCPIRSLLKHAVFRCKGATASEWADLSPGRWNRLGRHDTQLPSGPPDAEPLARAAQETSRHGAGVWALRAQKFLPALSPPQTVSSPPNASAPPSSAWFTDEVQPHDVSLKAYLRGSFLTVRDVDDIVQESYLVARWWLGAPPRRRRPRRGQRTPKAKARARLVWKMSRSCGVRPGRGCVGRSPTTEIGRPGRTRASLRWPSIPVPPLTQPRRRELDVVHPEDLQGRRPVEA